MISAPARAPRSTPKQLRESARTSLDAPCYDRGVSVDVAAAWGGLLEGEELAHLGEEPRGRGPSAPLPEGSTRASAARSPDRRALRAPGRGVGRGRARRARHRHDRHRVAARRSRSTCPSSTRSRASRRTARSTSTRRRRSRRTSCARCTSSRVPRLRAGDLRRRHAERERRWQIRRWANLVLTNPDMLHIGVLPHHDRWGDVLQNLRYVVVDEAHVYRGVFGSHVGNVLRRLRRLARDLRRRAAVPARVRDDREPGRARASRRSASTRRSSATTARRAPSGRSSLWNPELLDEELGVRASRARRRVAPARRARRAAASARSASRRAARPRS